MNSKSQGQATHGGVGHWWYQRLSSVILIPLTIWLLWAITQLAGADYAGALAFFASPLQKGFAIAYIGMVAYHAQTGIQVVCEDYIYPPWFQSLLIILTKVAVTVGFLATVYALFNLPAGA
jgi:succinate dehydrogenase / fumarate reductase membrane anchor subunit